MDTRDPVSEKCVHSSLPAYLLHIFIVPFKYMFSLCHSALHMEVTHLLFPVNSDCLIQGVEQNGYFSSNTYNVKLFLFFALYQATALMVTWE